MKIRVVQFLAALALLLSASAAQALTTCTITSPGFVTTYPVNSASFVITQTSYTISCSRASTTLDPGSFTYSVKVNNGTNPNGQNNRATSGGNTLKYDDYIDGSCSTAWKGNTTIPSTAATITISGLGPTTVTQNFWGCVTALQSPAAGTYTDTVTLTPTYSNVLVTGGTGTSSVTVITPPTCAVASIPDISISYTAFRTTAATGTTAAGVTCSNSLPYTMAVSPTSGTSAGISYSLSVPASGTGSGGSQSITITATAAAGQAGSCATGTCIGAAQPHTLTVTY
jgi:spore coat protein U-like protein